MINISSELTQLLQTQTRCYQYAKVTLADNTILNLTPDNFTILNNGISDGSGLTTFPIGLAIEKIIQIEIANIDGEFDSYLFDDAVIELELRYTLSNSTETIVRGTYTVIEPATYGTTIIITAADDMYKADKLISGTITFPITLGSLASAICTATDITLASSTFTNSTLSISGFAGDYTQYTYRQLLGFIAQLAGGNARINYDNELEFLSYPFTTMATMQTAIDNDTLDLTTGQLNILNNWESLNHATDNVTITGIQTTLYANQLADDDSRESDTLLIGTDDYVIEIENPFLNYSNASTYLAAIGTLLIGGTLMPFDGSYISNPVLEFMDPVYIVDRKENVYVSVLTDVDFQVLGKTELKNSSEPKLRNGKVYSSASHTAQLHAVESSEKKVTNISNYFWHDLAGAHVTTHELDATTGPNVLIDAYGMDVRNGTNLLAHYGNEIQIGSNDKNRIIISQNGIAGQNEADVSIFDISMNGATGLTTTNKYVSKHAYASTSTGTLSYTLPYSDLISETSVRLYCRHTWAVRPGSPELHTTDFSFDITIGTSKNDTYSDSDITVGLQYDGIDNIIFSFALNHSETSAKFYFLSYDYQVTTPAPATTLGTRKGNMGAYSAVIGESLFASSDNQIVIGKYNIQDAENAYTFIIGNGTDDDNRSNALTVDWDGVLSIGGLALGSEDVKTDWTSFFRRNTVTLTDADNAPALTQYYISSSDIAATISNLPSQSAGVLFTYGNSNRRYQAYWLRGTSNTIYVRNEGTGTWGNWIELAAAGSVAPNGLPTGGSAGQVLVKTSSTNYAASWKTSRYIHEQGTAASTWEITHNMDCYPSVTVVDSTLTEVVGQIQYTNTNSLTITFNAAFKGKAYLN